MKNMVFTPEEGALMLDALDALRQFNMPDYLRAKTDALEFRISHGPYALTNGEVKNICLGLEVLLASDPMDWKANTLLQRLRSEFDLPKQL